MNSMPRALIGFSLLAALAAGSACRKRTQAAPAENEQEQTGSADPASEAREIFTSRCVSCHGSTGGGDGPASASLNPHPRNFHDTAWQAAVTDEHIERIIVGGGAAVGKSPAMPGNPDLNGRAAVVQALRAHIRTFR